jgi:hypothetical protein
LLYSHYQDSQGFNKLKISFEQLLEILINDNHIKNQIQCKRKQKRLSEKEDRSKRTRRKKRETIER